AARLRRPLGYRTTVLGLEEPRLGPRSRRPAGPAPPRPLAHRLRGRHLVAARCGAPRGYRPPRRPSAPGRAAPPPPGPTPPPPIPARSSLARQTQPVHLWPGSLPARHRANGHSAAVLDLPRLGRSPLVRPVRSGLSWPRPLTA